MKIEITDYKQASNIAKTLDLHAEVTIKVNIVGHFRKYLRDCSKGKEFVTKVVENGIKITRLK